MSDPETEEVVSEELDIEAAFVRMGELIEELQGVGDDTVRDKVFELLDWVDAFHREAIVRLEARLDRELMQDLREDPVVAQLLDTYLEEEDEPEQLQEMLEEALDEIRPYLHSHGGEMEVMDVSGGVVHMRLMGSCDGCPSSTQTLTQGVEKILRERWPSFRRVQVEGVEEPPAPKKLLQIQTLKRE